MFIVNRGLSAVVVDVVVVVVSVALSPIRLIRAHTWNSLLIIWQCDRKIKNRITICVNCDFCQLFLIKTDELSLIFGFGLVSGRQRRHTCNRRIVCQSEYTSSENVRLSSERLSFESSRRIEDERMKIDQLLNNRLAFKRRFFVLKKNTKKKYIKRFSFGSPTETHASKFSFRFLESQNIKLAIRLVVSRVFCLSIYIFENNFWTFQSLSLRLCVGSCSFCFLIATIVVSTVLFLCDLQFCHLLSKGRFPMHPRWRRGSTECDGCERHALARRSDCSIRSRRIARSEIQS